MNRPLLVHKNENLMFAICILTTISLLIYLIISVIGVIVFIVLGLVTLLTHAISMSHIQVNSVRVRENQFPEIYHKVQTISEKMEMKHIPEVYIIESGGLLNAFATKVFGYFGKNMVVLYSDFVDISIESPGKELDYVIAHELAHIKRNHIVKSLLVYPAMWIPFIGSTYSRMAEYTCDRMAAYYTGDLDAAKNGLLIFAAGRRLYQDVNLKLFLEQYNEKKGLFVTLTELLSTHPPLPKRIHELENLMTDEPTVPLRNRGRQVIALFLIIYLVFPLVLGGLAFAGFKVFDKFGLLDDFTYELNYTPLMEAASSGDIDLVRQLLEEGENPNQLIDTGESALIVAVINGHTEVLQLLIDYGADPNLPDNYGWTPLMSAVVNENLQSAEQLLKAGANPLQKDVDGMSSIDHAKEYGDLEMESLLRSYIKQ